MSNQISLEHFVDLAACLSGELFKGRSPFGLTGKNLTEVLHPRLRELGVEKKPVLKGQVAPSAVIEGAVFVAAGATIEPHTFITGPCVIESGAEVRHGAYIRGNVYVGPGAVVGHTTEVKGSVFFDGAKAGHFAYVGDAILGRNVNLGAGTKLANLPLRRGIITINPREGGEPISTGLKKFSAILGDDVQTGCNAVISPGSLLYPGTAVFPNAHFHGVLKSGIFRSR